MARILFTEPAEYDLLDIEYYIHVHLCNPQAAERVTEGILERIKTLADYPMSHPCVQDELLNRIEIRVTWFENYSVFYTYDEETDVVSIMRILYAKADWKTLLGRE